MPLPVKVSLLQKLDRWVFPIVCLFLTLIRKLSEFTSRESESKIRSLLFVKLAEQGSSVLAIPAIEEAVRMVGSENVYALVFKENRFILDVIGLIPSENILTVDHSSVLAMAKGTLSQLNKIGRASCRERVCQYV